MSSASGRRRNNSVEEFFFENSKVTFEVFEVGRHRRRTRERGKPIGNFRCGLAGQTGERCGFQSNSGLREVAGEYDPTRDRAAAESDFGFGSADGGFS